MGQTKILIADDHQLFVEGLRKILESEHELVGSVEDGRALLDAVKEKRPDLVLLDVSMPLLNGLDATRQLKKLYPDLKIIILTMHADVGFATQAFDAGAAGYVVKHSASEELRGAIREVIAGRVYISPVIAGELLHSYRTAASKARDISARLTARQREVLQLIAEGKTAKEIAAVLNVSPRTIEFHKYKMMEDLGLKTTAELTQYAVKHGLVTL